MNNPKVSVIIPTYRRAAMLCECIRSVLASTWKNLEVIAADDCSPDDTKEIVEREFAGDARVKYTRTRCNLLTSGARNQGVRVATGDYYFFLDDDNHLEPDCIAELLAVFDKRKDAAFVAPLSVNGEGGNERTVMTTGTCFNFWTSRPVDTTPPGTCLNSLPPGKEWPTAASPNAFMVSKATFDRVNGFDEGYGMQFDEMDFGIRVTSLVGSGWISTRAQTKHLGFARPEEISVLRRLSIERPKRAFAFGRNRMKFMRRHAKWYQACVVMLGFAPLSMAYYLMQAVRYHAPFNGLAYVAGTIAGILGLYRTRGYR